MTDGPATRLERLGRAGLRSAMVIVFLVFGAQKFTAIEAAGIEPLVSHSPLTSWLLEFGVRDMSRVFGCAELTFGLLLATGLFREGARSAILGAVGSCVTFLTTLSFLLTTPGVFAPGEAPVLSSDGLFLVKDLILLAASMLLLAQSVMARAGREQKVDTSLRLARCNRNPTRVTEHLRRSGSRLTEATSRRTCDRALRITFPERDGHRPSADRRRRSILPGWAPAGRWK